MTICIDILYASMISIKSRYKFMNTFTIQINLYIYIYSYVLVICCSILWEKTHTGSPRGWIFEGHVFAPARCLLIGWMSQCKSKEALTAWRSGPVLHMTAQNKSQK